MASDPIPTWFFAVVVVRRADRFLLVRERKHGQTWYLPAGRVEGGETLPAAAWRETMEEAGIAITLTGVLRIEHSLIVGGARIRAIFLAEPADDRPPKSVGDAETLGGEWVSIDELERYAFRWPDVEALLRDVTNGGPVYPLGVLASEGMPYA